MASNDCGGARLGDLGPCGLVLLSACCSGALMVVKDGTEADGSWFRSDEGGVTITGCANIERCWALSVA